MVFEPPLVVGTFIRRLNRFAGRALVDGRDVPVHIPNSGRMTELLLEGAPVGLARAPEGSQRKTDYDLVLVQHGEEWVGVDSRAPTPLFLEAFAAGRLDPFRGYTEYEREVTWGESRFDVLLSGPKGPCLVETKSVNLVEDGTAMFPDAPTVRGTRHVEELVKAYEEGLQTAVVFVIQRADAQRFTPYDEADPVFGRALRSAHKAGVKLYAYTCRVTLSSMELDEGVPVVL